MTPLRRSAKGEDCTIQLHPYCSNDPEQAQLCHAPSQDKGIGNKSPDWWGAYGCSSCHKILDGGYVFTDLSKEEVYRCFMRGVFRTQKLMIEKGLINVKGY